MQLSPDSDFVNHLFQRSPAVLYQFYLDQNGDMGFYYLSDSAVTLYERPLSELLNGSHLAFSYVHPEDAIVLRENIAASAKNLSQFQWTGRFLFADGREKTVNAVSAPRHESKTRIVWEGVMMDVSTFADVDPEELSESTKLAALGESTGWLCHEINNPITAIKGNLELARLALGDGDLSRVNTYVDKTQAVVNRLEKIVQSFLVISRSTVSRIDGFQNESFADIFTDLRNLCQERFDANTVTLKLIDRTHSKFPCRRTDLVQVLLNLLNNSFDEVHSAPLEKRWVSVEASELRDSFVIVVSDGGSIPDEVREKIFSPRFTTKPLGKGTGLGLKIVSSILDVYGGKIRLLPEAKTKFLIEIPRRK